MGKKLYVGNLEWSVTDEMLKEYFETVGEVVSATVILVRDTGRSRGFGFVEMVSEKDTKNVIKSLDGTQFNNRPIVVREALPEGEKRSGPKGKLDKINKFLNKARAGEKMEVLSGRKHFTIVCDDDSLEIRIGEADVPIDYR